MLKSRVKNQVLHFVNSPGNNILSSQTLYESLLFCLDMYNLTLEEAWFVEAKVIAKMISENQNPDGGFDIGYNFIFGNNLSKKTMKESTTPEILSLYALVKYQKVTGDKSFEEAIEKATSWVIEHSYRYKGDFYVIPYAPLTYKEVHITNGVSFTIGAISELIDLNPQVVEVLDGMINFMHSELEEAEKGSYWRYFHRESSSYTNNIAKDKVDNFHIAQQLRYHCVAQCNYPNKKNLEIINRVTTYLLNSIDNEGWIPYVIKGDKMTDKVDIWGYASVLKGLVEASEFIDNKDIMHKVEKIKNNILEFSWNGEYFNPIILKGGKPFDKRFYPRSDAWVIHSLSRYMLKEGFSEDLFKICERNYKLIRSNGFRGKENHTITKRKLFFAKLVSILK
ncbi:hypothetical protein [Bacillus sp. N1-1]|uniref:hypothetical protein n=1 Tax=Bacillus sp. N1-1 TaxID=2682541 RepID=UPI001315D062|nr:hypothetical protein [Bacillus sp. N1-1]QHA93678.1 hypothetical protein GNK04_20835 [Bacillus sp. N1-1]